MKLLDAKIGYYKNYEILIKPIDGYELDDGMMNVEVKDPNGNYFFNHADGMRIEDAVEIAQQKIDEYLED